MDTRAGNVQELNFHRASKRARIHSPMVTVEEALLTNVMQDASQRFELLSLARVNTGDDHQEIIPLVGKSSELLRT